MRRSLVLTDESARHPFLASLPSYVRHGERPVPSRMPWRITSGDMRDFLLAYSSCFLVVSLYIA
jgi:hypothetical protein